MAKIIVGEHIKKSVLIDGAFIDNPIADPSNHMKGLKDQLTKAVYLNTFKNANDNLTVAQLNTQCTGGKNNTIELEWKETSNGIELVNPLIYTVLPNEDGRVLLLGVDNNGGIDGRGLFSAVVSPKPSSWVQYIRNITISVKGDGEA